MSVTRLKIPLADGFDKVDYQSIRILIDDLSAFGIHVELSASSSDSLLIFEYDLQASKRNAGRKRKEIPQKSALRNMTPKEIDSWLLNQPIQTISKELEIGRATAFRRRAEARERLAYFLTSLEDDVDE